MVGPLSQDNEGFDAYVCHPQFGSGMVRGQLFVNLQDIRFVYAEESFTLPLDEITLKLEKAGHWITLVDRRQKDRQFQVESRILEDDVFVKSFWIRDQLRSQLTRREMARRVRVILIFILVFVSIIFVASKVAGWMVPVIAKRIPVSSEIALGDEAFNKIRSQIHLVDDTNATAELTELAHPLIQTLPAKGIPFSFYIIEGPPNAFALPGGKIMVTTALLRLLDTQDQLLGILAHESAHIMQHHADQQMLTESGPLFILRILTSGDNGTLRLLAGSSKLLIHDSFSQRYEKEADFYGWDYLVAAHINPHGLIEGLEKLRDSEPPSLLTNELESHPDINRRISWLEAKWKALPDHDDFIALTNPIPKIF
jgi:Zn-dependent protease with chaperone function